MTDRTDKYYEIKLRLPAAFKPVIDQAAASEDRSNNNWIMRAVRQELIQKGYKNRLPKGV